MYGAMIGDIVGSKYEFNNIKTKEFPLFSEGCAITDNSVMTVAVTSAILKSRDEQYHSGKRTFRSILVEEMQRYGKRFPHPQGGYGGRFGQ
ncbi:MAG: hypothetical protein LUE24_02700 [Lachnospiraceae bacterium]|nr:hypothetical protein [Lachnospiraceae bacterium]